MKANTASRTAQYMALFRALETRRPKDKRLFSDPYAIHFLDRRLRIISRCASLPLINNRISKIIQKKIPGAYSSGLSRTKFIDDLVIQTIGRGTKQLIILGAGFDTRALRLDSLRNIPVVEIDHPDTAALKINTLKKINHCLPANVRYLQIDFNKQSLQNLLKENNVDTMLPTTIVWEGVTNYLSKEAIDSTFAVLNLFAKGSFVIFTYVNSEVLNNPSSFFGAEKLLTDLTTIEERWTFGFNPSELKPYLTNYNFKLLHDAGAAEYRHQYIPERCELNKGYEFYRVAFAKKQ